MLRTKEEEEKTEILGRRVQHVRGPQRGSETGAVSVAASVRGTGVFERRATGGF